VTLKCHKSVYPVACHIQPAYNPSGPDVLDARLDSARLVGDMDVLAFVLWETLGAAKGASDSAGLVRELRRQRSVETCCMRSAYEGRHGVVNVDEVVDMTRMPPL